MAIDMAIKEGGIVKHLTIFTDIRQLYYYLLDQGSNWDRSSYKRYTG
jgi:hypothetical protein